MFFISASRKRDPDRIFVNIERYNRDAKSVLIDFVDSNEIVLFNSFSDQNYEWETRPTMIEVLNYHQKPVKEGVNYSISKERILSIRQRLEIVQDSFIIGFRLELNKEDEVLFERAKAFSEDEKILRNIDQTQESELPSSINTKGTETKVVVRNVGQGNWNEIWLNSKVLLVYDIGTKYTTSRTDLINMIATRDDIYQDSKPILVLSHWDVDHYHFLIALKDATIQAFSLFVYRGTIPNLTARKVIGRFNILNYNILQPLAAVPATPLRSSKKLQSQNFTSNKSIQLFNAFSNRSRNTSGIGLTLRTVSSCVIFSGDFNYSQVSDDILPTLNYNCRHYLIVPHHGGKAGPFKYNYSRKNVLKEAIISVGINPYRPPHPHQNNMDSLRAIGFKIIRTDIIGTDYEINL